MDEQSEYSNDPIYRNYKNLKCWQKIIKKSYNYTQLNDRKIITNIPDPQLDDNSIQTSKYNILTFLPLNLIQQFTKPSNIYFLLIGILQIIPQITISQGRPTMFLPLTIVVAVSMIKDFVQDWKRHKNDKRQNSSEVEVITQIGISKRKWKSIKVGQIIKVKKDQYFPCDILLMQHDKQMKLAYIQTKNLDGQNNLKLKKVSDCLSKNYLQNQLQFVNLRYEVNFQKPNPFLNVFNGNIKINNKKYILDNNNIILRGCSLKINEYVIGMCLYNGHESKILLNSAQAKPKRSYVQTYLYSYFKYIFIFQLAVTLASAITYGVMLAKNYSTESYFNESSDFFLDTIFTWGSWFISFSNFIPISLLVTLQVVRFGQGKIIENDPQCKIGSHNIQVQTSSINDDLGQVQYILSDKTGTLTKNQMDFKFFCINGVSYGQNQILDFKKQKENRFYQSQNNNNQFPFDLKNDLQQQESQPDTYRKTLLQSLKTSNVQNKKRKTRKSSLHSTNELKQNICFKIPNVDFPQIQKQKILYDMKKSTKDKQSIKLGLVHLALCHNVICEGQNYTSSSPDQVALTSFAKYIGYTFIRKNDKNQMEIEQLLPNQKSRILKYQLLHILQFSSQRKRMSVIVKQKKQKKQRILLLCKGADDIILKKLGQYPQNKSQNLKNIQDQLFNYACKGLRTLLLAYKQVDEQFYFNWNKRYNETLTLLTADRYDKIAQLQQQIQIQMRFVAITAIQDKLQNEVKQTISQLKKSNIKVWMLTGDKKQTAISIGYSCGLIDPTNEVITFDCEPQHAKQLVKNVAKMLSIIKQDKVTVLTGQFMSKLDQQGKQVLSQILKQSVSVVCCRVSPKSKAQITNIVKKWGITLAIGDGANDVNMINSAHIGVGVRGIQGSQATRAADYVICQFKLLKRLVIFYGINFYHRNCGVVLFTLYKNIMVTFPILFYGPLSVQSGTYIYQMWIIQFYNIFFVALPIIYFGLFDTIYSQRQLINKPYLYKQGQQKQYFSRVILVRQIITTILTSIFLVITSYFITNFTLISNGLMAYQEWCGMMIFNIVVISCNIRIFNMSNQFNSIQFLLCLFGIGSYYFMFFIIQTLFYLDIKNTLDHQVTTWLFWSLIFLYCFVIEGSFFIGSRLTFIKRKKTQLQYKQKFIKQQSYVIQKKYALKLQDIAQEKRNTIGGYAFAQAQERSLHFI